MRKRTKLTILVVLGLLVLPALFTMGPVFADECGCDGCPPCPPPCPPCPPPPCEPTQGCTPGYWKQPHHWDSWIPTGYSPDDLVCDVFAVVPCDLNDDGEDDTLLDALKYKGGRGLDGAMRILLRAGVAALLNATHPGVDTCRMEGWIIEQVGDLYLDGDRGSIICQYENHWDPMNNLGCPLN